METMPLSRITHAGIVAWMAGMRTEGLSASRTRQAYHLLSSDAEHRTRVASMRRLATRIRTLTGEIDDAQTELVDLTRALCARPARRDRHRAHHHSPDPGQLVSPGEAGPAADRPCLGLAGLGAAAAGLLHLLGRQRLLGGSVGDRRRVEVHRGNLIDNTREVAQMFVRRALDGESRHRVYNFAVSDDVQHAQ
ncbi:MAG: hypothetical protein ACR2JU_08535 [Nocardioidaceae bacterium]